MALLVHLVLLFVLIKSFLYANTKVTLDICPSQTGCITDRDNKCVWNLMFCNSEKNKLKLEVKSITGVSSSCAAATVEVVSSGSIEANQECYISTKMFEISSQVSLCSARAKLQISPINNNKVTITFLGVDFLFGLMNYSISNPSLSCSSLDGSSGSHVISYNVSFCPDNSTNFICNDTFLKFYQEPISWIKALQKCHKLRSRLVPITNETVWRDFKSLLQKNTDLKNGVWVGLERSIFGTNAEWKWISGINADPKWNSTFPVDRFNNHCGKVVWVEQIEKYRLLDANCHDELPFICQALPVNGN